MARIGPGLLLLVGIGKDDLYEPIRSLAGKISRLRIFEDTNGKMNRSVLDAKGQILAVSQFTLYADCRKGNRPGFDRAAPAGEARRMFDFFVSVLKSEGLDVQTGRFGAHMDVSLVNDGPVTIWLDTETPALIHFHHLLQNGTGIGCCFLRVCFV